MRWQVVGAASVEGPFEGIGSTVTVACTAAVPPRPTQVSPSSSRVASTLESALERLRLHYTVQVEDR